jgi:glutathione synthase/RimK-type ligase-like ATP-grasp enzyme
MPKDVYIYYSGATDKTGDLLAKALDITGGRKSPGQSKKVVIGWGAKTDKKVALGKAIVINHPDHIRTNRNKFQAMLQMEQAGVNIAPFVDTAGVMAALDSKTSDVALPLIARTNYHQGGANFFTCLTRTHVTQTIADLANTLKKKGYFQNYIDVESEFRLHVADGKVIYAQRKTPRKNMAEAYAADQTDKIKRMAEKKKTKIDDATLKFALDYQGGKVTTADLIIKSNTRGYKFSNVKLENVDKNLAVEATKAVTALNLQFGAVDCVIDTSKKAWIIEVNTGPGLEGTAFKNYVAAFSTMINNILAPPKPTAAPMTKQTIAPLNPSTAPKSKPGAVKVDAARLRMLADMLDEADETESDAVNAVAARMFKG